MSEVLNKKLHTAIDGLNDEQKKAVLGIVKVFATEREKRSDHWKDKSFVAEMNDRYREYKSGKADLISLDDVENKAKKLSQKLKSKKAS
jgi:hypothetical protein